MSQQTSPFLEGKYGWSFGEGGWNTGMDENLLKFSFMFDRNVDSVVESLPGAINGQAHYLTTDNRLYFAVGTVYFSSPVPKWFTIVVRSTGQTHQFNGTSLVQVDTPVQTASRLDGVELTVSALGTAAFEDIEFFATQADLDVAEADAANYTDSLRSDLAAHGGYLLVSGGDFSSATADLALFAGVTRTISELAGDVVRLDTFPGITPNDPAIDNGPTVNAVLAIAAANKIPVDGYGATIYTLTPILPQSGQILRNCTFKSKGSPDGAGVPKSHISVIHIDGTSALKTGMYFEDVIADGSRSLWPNISTATVGPEGGGGEDGGMHAWRIAGNVTSSDWKRCKGINAGTAGWAIHEPLPSTASVIYRHQNLRFEDCDGTGNREHGMFADSFKNLQWIRGKLTGNGLDLNGTDPLVHGNRGCRDPNGDLFGMPFDFEAYAPNFLGSLYTEALMEGVDCRGNAICASLINPIASDLAGFVPVREIRLMDCDFDQGLAPIGDRPPSTDNLSLNVLGSLVTNDPFSGMTINSRLSGRPSFNGVAKLNVGNGFIESIAPKAIVNNSSYFDLSCASLSPELTVFPQPVATITKTGGSAGATFTPTLQSTRARPGGGVVLTYSVAIGGALAAGGELTASVTPPAGYYIDDIKWDVSVTTPAKSVRSCSSILGLGTSATTATDTSNNDSLTASMRVSLAPKV